MRHEKPELSEKNPYHLSRHRYYELKHFASNTLSGKRALHWRAVGKRMEMTLAAS